MKPQALKASKSVQERRVFEDSVGYEGFKEEEMEPMHLLYSRGGMITKRDRQAPAIVQQEW